MNTNSNTYTVIYSIILVVIVAAVLAFVSMALAPKQNENVKKETISQVLTAAAQADETVTIAEDADVMTLYTEMAVAAFTVDGNGKKVGEMNLGKENKNDILVASTSDLKKQNDIIKKIEAGQTDLLSTLELPVYIINVNGKDITVIPCYGAGLWGPVWGYLAVNADGKTLEGSVFDHKGETPGLGAKITEQFFEDQFKGKVFGEGETKFEVIKGGAKGQENGVDAISGATITTQALGKAINIWAKYYEPYLIYSKFVLEYYTPSGLEVGDCTCADEDCGGEAEACSDSTAVNEVKPNVEEQ